MDDLGNYKRTRKRKKYDQHYLKGILDIIEADYPDKYARMFEDHSKIKTMFSDEEWLDILTKSRNSYKCHINRIERTIKRAAKNNRKTLKLIPSDSSLDKQ